MDRRRWAWLSAWLLAVGALQAAVAPAAPEVDIRRDATVAAIERVTPSVVNIRTSKLVQRNTLEDEIRRRYFGWKSTAPTEEEINSIGSGVIIEATEDEGYILTNFHVLQQAQRVQVQLWDGREYEAAPLRGQVQKDLVLLKIIRKPGDKPFKPVAMAPDDDLLLGETVIAMGNPFGLGSAVTRGILSSKNRRSTPGNTSLNFQDWLQTDADINPGNSGGPLINIRGELIGINVAVYNQEEGKGTGFAIPVKQISSALSDFFTIEWTAKLWLGARFLGAPHPVTVREVQPNSPAYRAGLRVGQQVVEVNGKPVRGLAGFNELVAASANRKAVFTVLENGTRQVLNVTLVPLADLNRELFAQRLGLITAPLTEQQATSAGLAAGLLVNDVEKNSPAASAKMEAGMIVTDVDNVAVDDLVNISNVLGNRKRGESVRLTVKVANRYQGGMMRLLTGQVDVPVR
jgi:serine protease Do